ncbi:hypothetical protein H2200_006642 [Cladophialophora chaetospira]|uniref:Transmembrane protein n=1 Tax=Cladophialophora chaetospira TaxID=386627 RepID=A0AA38X8K9_9EURO|nr:hypothetical protein H2200_006642 [Cladophialophora chaetospira]
MSLRVNSFTTQWVTETTATSVFVSPTFISSDVTSETISTAVVVSPVLFSSDFTTQTVTTAVLVSPVFISSDVTTSVTYRLASTIFATIGQTITIQTPSSIPTPTVVAPTTKYTPSLVTGTDPTLTTTLTSTLTFTELDIYFQNSVGSVFSTQVIPYTPFLPPNPTNTQDPGLVYVVHPSSGANDWDSWSKGERAGLIVGVVLGACLLFAMIWYCCRKPWRGNWWFAHGQHVGQAPVVATPQAGFVQPAYANGAVVPYGYHGGPGYGLRGGDADSRGKRLFSGRNWFSVKGRNGHIEQQRSESVEGDKEEASQAGTVRKYGWRKTSGTNWFSTGRVRDVGREEHGEAEDVIAHDAGAACSPAPQH